VLPTPGNLEMPERPSGTITFLFTDIEGSTRLWEQHPRGMPAVLARHHALLTEGIEQHGGTVITSQGEGDSFFAVFRRSTDAVAAAVALQRALQAEPWPTEMPLRVRMALHTGEAELRNGDYLGVAVNRCARLRAVAHGGQVLLSQTTHDLVRDALPEGARLLDLGEQPLRDLTRPERVFQLAHPDLPADFPPLATPRPAVERRARDARPSHRARKGGAPRGIVRWRTAALAVVALGALLGGIGLLRGVTGRSTTPAGAPPAIRSLAVLPLKNLSNDPSQDYFADGMTDSLTTDLAHIHSLRVISFQSVQQYKGERRKRLAEIARELNVDAVLEGSVQKSGDTVMINAQLIRAPTEEHLWAERYLRKAADVLRAQNQIVMAIADAIQARLTPHERSRFTRGRSVDPEAQSHYFLGRFQFGQGTEAGFRQAIQEYESTIQKDPDFAPAYAGVADAYSSLSSMFIPPREAMPKAEAAARKALALDPDLAEAHSALGFIQLFYHWNRREGERELLKAIELKPNYSTARLNHALLLLTEGRYGEGLQQLRTAQELEPTSALISSLTEWALFLDGKYDQTIAQARHTLELEPKMSASHGQIGLVYLYQGKMEPALAELKTALAMERTTFNATNYALGLAAAGKKEEALRVVHRFLEQTKGKYVCAYEIACAYEGMKDRATALRWLLQGEAEKCDCLVWGGVEPWMAGIQKDPRYQAILARNGLLQ
jgi:class 3 adenylate cyclase/TolB-like protein/Flp pilus assembly protein TadD